MTINLRDNQNLGQTVQRTGGFRIGRRVVILGVIFALAIGQVLGFSAFEAHVINVTAYIKNDVPNIFPGGRQFCNTGPVEITLWTDVANAEIIYTLDGIDPICGAQLDVPAYGTLYTGPFLIFETTTIKASTCHNPSQSAVKTWVFELEPEYCDEDCGIEPGDFCSQTQGGWGTACQGNNPGCMRNDNWDSVIGGDLVVGTGYSLTFSSASSVEAYLPGGGTAAVLTQDHNDPASTESGVFGAQVTALKLNVLFSAAGIGLNGPDDPTPIGELVIDSGPFIGLSVNDFLALAEEVLGGSTSGLAVYSASVSDVNDAAASINENFVDCEIDNGFLQTEECCEAIPASEQTLISESREPLIENIPEIEPLSFGLPINPDKTEEEPPFAEASEGEPPFADPSADETGAMEDEEEENDGEENGGNSEEGTEGEDEEENINEEPEEEINNEDNPDDDILISMMMLDLKK